MLRLIAIILFSLIISAQSAFCASYRVKDIIIDNSDKVVVIKGEGNFKVQSIESNVPIPNASGDSIRLLNNISAFTISAPNRYVIDIPNASLIGGSRNYKIKNSKMLSNISLAQFSANPDVVRIVFSVNNASNLSKFKTYTNGTDIIVQYSPNIVENSIQYKFYTPSGDSDKNANPQNTQATVTYNHNDNTIDIIPRFQTKYYLSRINQNSDGLILRGIGSLSFQRVSYNQDNTIASLILDSATLASKLDNKTYNIPSSKKNIQATLTINKLNSKKVKLTLNGQNLKDYRFVVSPDGQSLFISHRTYVINTAFSSTGAKINSYKFTSNQNGYKIFDFNFNLPATYDVFELNDNFYMDINNLSDYNAALFEQTFKSADTKIQVLKISSDKTRYIIPIKDLNFAYANVESNAKSIKLCFKKKTPSQEEIASNSNSNIINISNVEKPKTEENINIIYVPKGEDVKIEKPKKIKENISISSMKKVVIDPGHGGMDSGAIGGGIYEKNLNLSVAKLVEEKLKKKNIYVYMTRSKDETLTLEDRVNYSNEINPDIYVSIHTNSTVQEDSYGLEVHYFKDDSLELAQIVHSNFASEKNLKKWETKDRGVIKSRFYVINHTEAPSILIEMGFISNLDERSKLITKNRQEEIANSIVKGILEYLK